MKSWPLNWQFHLLIKKTPGFVNKWHFKLKPQRFQMLQCSKRKESALIEQVSIRITVRFQSPCWLRPWHMERKHIEGREAGFPSPPPTPVSFRKKWLYCFMGKTHKTRSRIHKLQPDILYIKYTSVNISTLIYMLCVSVSTCECVCLGLKKITITPSLP